VTRARRSATTDLSTPGASDPGAPRRLPELPLAALRAALEYADEGLLITSTAGQILAAGSAAAQIFGLPEEELQRRSLVELLGVGPEQLAGAPPGAPPRELSVTQPGGAVLALVVRAVPLPGGGHLVLITDLSSVRRAQEQARRRDRLAALGELSAGVAHEIRNPLAGIATSAQVLKNRLDPHDERRRFLEVIQEEVNRLDRIVSGLLDYARPWSLSLKRVSVVECVQKVTDLVRETCDAQGVALQLHCPDDLPEIFADRDQLTQVLLNIFRNALEAMPHGGVLRVEARLAERPPFVRRSGGRRAEDQLLPQGGQPRPRPVVQLRVSDTGEGILAEHLPRLFDPFFTTKATGTGLGLAICQTLIHEHGGSISADSVPGKGTVITIELPLEKRHGQRRKDG